MRPDHALVRDSQVGDKGEQKLSGSYAPGTKKQCGRSLSKFQKAKEPSGFTHPWFCNQGQNPAGMDPMRQGMPTASRCGGLK